MKKRRPTLTRSSMAWHWHTSPPRGSLCFGHVDFLQSSEHAMPTVLGLLCTIFSVRNALCSPPYILVFPPSYLLVWLLHNLQISAEACLSCSLFQNSAWSTARAVYLFFWMSTLTGTLLHGYLASSEVQECWQTLHPNMGWSWANLSLVCVDSFSKSSDWCTTMLGWNPVMCKTCLGNAKWDMLGKRW